MQQRLGITAIVVSICLLPVNATIAQLVEQNLPNSQVTPGSPIKFQASGEGKRPNDVALTADWQSLLESVRLSEIAKEPFIGELKAVVK